MNFATFTHFSVSVVSSAATEMSYEDAGRGELCVDRMGSVPGDRMGSVPGDRMGSVCGDRVGSVCGDRVGRFYGDRMHHRVEFFFILTNKHHNSNYRRP